MKETMCKWVFFLNVRILLNNSDTEHINHVQWTTIDMVIHSNNNK